MSSRRYRKDIDGIRAIAVIGVVLFHLFPRLLPGGFVGVDIFFVLSGYLISGNLFETIDSGSFSLLGFYVRRIRRIYPALIVMLIVSLAFGWFTLFNSEYQELGKLAAAGASFLANIVLWKTTGYFNTSARDQILLHLWSLGVEEQYYIVWPLFLLLFRRKLPSLLGWIVGITGFSFMLNLALIHLRPTATFYLPVTRFWELLIGALLAYLELYRSDWMDDTLGRYIPGRSVTECKAFLGVALLLTSLVALNSNTIFPGWWALLPTVGTFFLVSAGPDSWISRKVLSNRMAIFVGVISYPIYLWHWPLLVYARILSDGAPSLEARLTILVITFVLSWLTYQYVERPLRFGVFFARFSGVRVAAGLFVVMIVIGLMGLSISRSGSRLSFRFPGAGTAAQLSDLQEVSPACKTLFPFATDFCRISDESRAPTVLLLGDSHAIHFYGAMTEHFDQQGDNLLTLGEGDCPPFYDVNVIVSEQAKKCPIMMDAALNLAMQQSSIHTLILSAFSSFAVTGYNFEEESGDHKYLRDTKEPAERDNETIFREGLRRTLAAATAANKKVYVVLDTPEINFSSLSCSVHRPLSLRERGIRSPCGISRILVDERERLTKTVMLSTIASFPDAIALDPIVALCDSSLCLAGKDGVPFYLDRNHLTPAGARYVVARLAWH